MSETILERPLLAPKPDGQAAKSFDFDRGAFVLRVMLCACLGACSIVISVLSWEVVTAALLLSIALPLTIVMAWFSALRLRIAAPIVVLDQTGIWDQRLGLEMVPWREVRSIELDRDIDVILEVGEQFHPAETATREEVLGFLPLGSVRQAGRFRIKLDDLDTTLPDFLATLDAVLPHHMQAPVCPAVLRRRPRQLVRPVFGGVVAGMMAALLIVAAGSMRENATIYRGLGAAKDIGVQSGDSGGNGFGRIMSRSSIAVQDQRVRLGYMYHEGRGVPRDDAKAARQFGLAAIDGVSEAQAALAFFRENGIGVEQDFIKALTWYRKAANQGDAWARTRLALMYRDGRGVPRDQEKAFQLLETAAGRGELSAQFYLGQAFENGWGVAENIAAAIEWYGEAAAQGYANAEYKLGSLYREGRNVPHDEARAIEWFERSGRKGYAPAQFALGLAHELGLGVPRDSKQADSWYYLAEWHGHPAAKHRRDQFLGSLSHDERLVAKSYRWRWLRDNFLSGPVRAKYEEYRRIRGPKAFAASMGGAYVIVDDARDQSEAAQRAVSRCRGFARTCLLYALGDKVVIGMGEPKIDAIIARGGQVPAR